MNTLDHINREIEHGRIRSRLGQAVRDGSVIKPERCSKCGKKPLSSSLHGHHPDYAKPFEVIWLCGACHRGVHVLLRWFDNCVGWLAFCKSKGMNPEDARLPAVHKKTGRPLKTTWYDKWKRDKR